MSPEPRQITFVSHTSKPGGGELALRRYLEATELPVRLVTLEAGGVWDGLDREVVHVSGVRGLRQALRGGGLVVANSMRAAFLAALFAPRKTRLVYWVRDGLTDSAMSRLALTLTKHVTARRTTHYLANSQWTASTVRTALRVADGRVDVVNSLCGIDARHVASPRSSPSRPLRLLYLGRLSRWKAPHVAIEATRLLQDRGLEVSLTVAGDAHFGEVEYARRLAGIAAATEGVTLVGHVRDIQGLLSDHDLMVHCSVSPEPFGQVVVQSLAAGVPPLATAGGGPSEILTGAPVDLLYPPGSAVGLVSTIERVLNRYGDVSRWAAGRALTFSDRSATASTDTTLTRLNGNISRQLR